MDPRGPCPRFGFSSLKARYKFVYLLTYLQWVDPGVTIGGSRGSGVNPGGSMGGSRGTMGGSRGTMGGSRGTMNGYRWYNKLIQGFNGRIQGVQWVYG